MSESEAGGDEMPGASDEDICRLAADKALEKGLSDEYCGGSEDLPAVLADSIEGFDGVDAEDVLAELESRAEAELDEEMDDIGEGDGADGDTLTAEELATGVGDAEDDEAAADGPESGPSEDAGEEPETAEQAEEDASEDADDGE